MKSIPLYEQEIIIRWDAEERTAHIDTAAPAIIRKLDKLAEQFPDTYKCVRVDENYLAKRYEVPASFINFKKPPSQARKEASQRAAAAALNARINSTLRR